MAAHPSSLLVTVATIGDPEGTRVVTSIIALLVAIGIGLLMVAVWLFRTTRPDPELLAPLEVMGERKWRRADPVWQRRRLDELRPDGAVPLTPSAAPPHIDEAFDAGPAAPGFDDLRVGSGSDDVPPDEHVLPPPAAPATETPREIARPPLDGPDSTDETDTGRSDEPDAPEAEHDEAEHDEAEHDEFGHDEPGAPDEPEHDESDAPDEPEHDEPEHDDAERSESRSHATRADGAVVVAGEVEVD